MTPLVPVAAAVGLAVRAASRRSPANPPLPEGWRRLAAAERTDEDSAFAAEARRTMGRIGTLQRRGRIAALTEWRYVEPGVWKLDVSLLTAR